VNKILNIILLICWVCFAKGQVINRPNDCSTPVPVIKPVFTQDQRNLINANKVLFTTPYPLKIHIKVFANDDGSNLAATEDNVLRQFENMRIAYASHNICFILSGYDIINNTDLNNMDVAEADDLSQIGPLVVTSCFTLFIHRSLVEAGDGLNGTAYAIPNYYFSMSSGAINSTTNLSTMPHELGHCLGLLHTFESFYGSENRARSGSCKDCEDDGDLLCDTQADRNVDDDFINSSCNYTGSLTDACGEALLMEETNIMTYGRRSCREFFTAGQADRMQGYILTTHVSRIAENALIVLSPHSQGSGRVNIAARNSISFSAASGYTISGSTNANYSSKSITITPGVEFKPSSGYVHVFLGVYCQ